MPHSERPKVQGKNCAYCTRTFRSSEVQWEHGGKFYHLPCLQVIQYNERRKSLGYWWLTDKDISER